MNLRLRRAWVLVAVAFLSVNAIAQETKLTTPAEHLGFAPGSDRNLADWEQITSYFKLVEAASPRVKLVELGRSPGGALMIAAYISSEENIARLPELLAAQKQLTYSPAAEDEAARREGHKLFVVISCSIHSTEIGASQMSMELLHRLAAGEDELTRMIRDRLVVILIPTPNPDGLNQVVEWYRRWLGTPYEGCSPPWLYQEYAGHDNNRDWYMLNLDETKTLNHWMSKVWFAQVVWDAHQMGSTGFRAVVPPFVGPPNPFIHPLVLEGIANAGHSMKAQAIRDGYRGLAHGTFFSVWWNGGFRTTPYFKNSIGLLTELASCKLATPIDVNEEQLKTRRALQKTVENPAPWSGGQWSLADIVGTELSLAEGLLRHCALNCDSIIADYRRMCLDAASAAEGGPAAYLLAWDQHDPAALQRLAELMGEHGIEVNELAKEVTLGERLYPEGTVLISGFQPFRPFIRSMFERLLYPAETEDADPYDISGWTLADQLGLEVRQVSGEEWKETGMAQITAPYQDRREQPPSTSTGETIYYAGDTANYLELNRVILDGGMVYREYPAEGYLPVRAAFIYYNPNRDASGYDISGKIQEAQEKSMRLPRLALMRGYMSSIDEGWTRYLLEQHGFPYKSIDEARIKEGELKRDFDAVILPDVNERSLVTGRQEEDYPPEFRGGIGEDGLRNLDEFVKTGGTLICLGNSCRVAVEKLSLPVEDLLKDVKREELHIPGSLIVMNPDPTHPVAFGMADKVAAMFIRSFAFGVSEENKDKVDIVARWAESDLLISGFARGEEKIAGKAAVVVVRHGDGRVVLIGFPCQFRAQPYSTFKLLFNAVYYAGDNAPFGMLLNLEPYPSQ